MQNIDILQVLEPTQVCFIQVSPRVAEELKDKPGLKIDALRVGKEDINFVVGNVSTLLHYANQSDEDYGNINLRWGVVQRVYTSDQFVKIFKSTETYIDFLKYYRR